MIPQLMSVLVDSLVESSSPRACWRSGRWEDRELLPQGLLEEWQVGRLRTPSPGLVGGVAGGKVENSFPRACWRSGRWEG